MDFGEDSGASLGFGLDSDVAMGFGLESGADVGFDLDADLQCWSSSSCSWLHAQPFASAVDVDVVCRHRAWPVAVYVCMAGTHSLNPPRAVLGP